MSSQTNDSTPTSDPLEQAYAEIERLVGNSCAQPCEEVIRRFSLNENTDAILELIYLEFVLRRDQGQSPSITEFKRRFPGLDDQIERLLEVDSIIGGGNEIVVSGSSLAIRQACAEESGFESRPNSLGQYRLAEVIGRGGMGVVYRATQKRLNRDVAIKTLNIPSSIEESSRDRFKAEASLAAQLQHPNIVPIYEIGSDDGVLFFSMEFVSGGSLAKVLGNGPLPAEVASRLVATLARAVDYAHSRGVVHRDLKPANVLLAPSTSLEAMVLDESTCQKNNSDQVEPLRFEPKIADFGLAKQLGSTNEMTVSGTMLGTPSFMAPEQVTGASDVGPACDIYALGAILYNAISGRPPFFSSNPIETARQVREVDATPLRHFQPRTPRDLETICQKCLRKNPSARYQSALELAEDLKRFLGGNPIKARPASVFERTSKWARRHPSLAGLIAAVGVALVTITILWRGAESSRNAEKSARTKAERLLYARDVSMVYSQLRLNQVNINRARELLDKAMPDARGWEWHYLQGLCDQQLWESPPKNENVMTSVLSPDGRFAALGYGQWGQNNREPIEVWDTWENKLVWELRGHPECQICSLQFSPDGQRLASSGVVWRDSEKKPAGVMLWNLRDGALERVIANVNAYAIAFSPTGTTLLVGESTGVIAEHSCADGTRVRELNGNRGLILDIRISPDGRFCAASGRNGTWGIFELATGRVCALQVEPGSDNRQVCWDGDSKSISVAGYKGEFRRFRFDGNSLTLLHSEKYDALPYLASSGDGTMRAIGVFGKDTEVRNSQSDDLVDSFNGHGGNVRAISFDASCQRLITGGVDGVARLWSIKNEGSMTSGRLTPRLSGASIACSPDSKCLAIATTQSRTMARTMKCIIEVRDAKTLELQHSFAENPEGLTSVVYREDGLQLLSAGNDKIVRAWNVEDFKLLGEMHGHNDAVVAATFVENNNRVVSVDRSGKVILWDANSYGKSTEWEIGSPVAAASICSQQGLLAVVGSQGELEIWDIKSQKQLRKWNSETASVLVFSNDGKFLATAGSRPEIDLWSVEGLRSSAKGAKPLRQLAGSLPSTVHMAFSPDDARLCAVGRDEKVHLFDTIFGNELLTLDSMKGHESVVSFTRDSRSLVNVNGNNFNAWRIPSRDTTHSLADDFSIESLRNWHRSQAEAARKLGQNQAGIYHLSRLMVLEPKKKPLYCQRAQFKMQIGDWLGAEKDFDLGLELFSPTIIRADYARTLLMLGRKNEYPLQHQLISLSANLSGVRGIDNAARSIALAPESATCAKRILPLVQRLLSRKVEPGVLNTLALLHYRCGNYNSAIAAAKKSLRSRDNPRQPLDWLIIALAERKQSASDDSSSDPNPTLDSPLFSDSLERVVNWCKEQSRQKSLGTERPSHLATTLSELELLYRELLQMSGGKPMPELDLSEIQK